MMGDVYKRYIDPPFPTFLSSITLTGRNVILIMGTDRNAEQLTRITIGYCHSFWKAKVEMDVAPKLPVPFKTRL